MSWAPFWARGRNLLKVPFKEVLTLRGCLCPGTSPSERLFKCLSWAPGLSHPGPGPAFLFVIIPLCLSDSLLVQSICSCYQGSGLCSSPHISSLIFLLLWHVAEAGCPADRQGLENRRPEEGLLSTGPSWLWVPRSVPPV